MRITMLQWHKVPDPTSEGAFTSFEQGRNYEVDDALASDLLAAGLCEPYEVAPAPEAVAIEESPAPAPVEIPEPDSNEKNRGRRVRPALTED